MLYGWSFHPTLAAWCLLTTLEVLVERFMALLGRKSLGADMEGSPRKIPLRWRAGTKSQQDLGFMFIQPASLLAFCIYIYIYIYSIHMFVYVMFKHRYHIGDLRWFNNWTYDKILVFFMGMMGTIRLSRCLIFQWPSLQLSSSFIWRWDVTFLQLTMIEVVSPSDTVIPNNSALPSQTHGPSWFHDLFGFFPWPCAIHFSIDDVHQGFRMIVHGLVVHHIDISSTIGQVNPSDNNQNSPLQKRAPCNQKPGFSDRRNFLSQDGKLQSPPRNNSQAVPWTERWGWVCSAVLGTEKDPDHKPRREKKSQVIWGINPTTPPVKPAHASTTKEV